jgi:hypothetical protein
LTQTGIETGLPISPKFGILPRENISPWKEFLEAAALAFCASHGPDGTLGLACDAASWLACTCNAGAVVLSCPARSIFTDGWNKRQDEKTRTERGGGMSTNLFERTWLKTYAERALNRQ